jgi:hypothetical protein
MRDHRIGLDLFTDVLDVLERHGFARGDDQHAGRAIFLIGDLARIYEGSQDHPYGPSLTHAPYLPPREPPGPEPEPSVPEDDPGAVTLSHTQVRTVRTALDLAADWKRGRAERCAYCADQSCSRCQLRLRDAHTYHQLAVQLRSDEQAARRLRGQAELPAPPSQPGLAADKEAGQ